VARLGDVTGAQWHALAAASRELGITWRTTIRQNLVALDVPESDLPRLHDRLTEAGLGACGDRAAAGVVSCPGTETCNRALTATRGVAAATIQALFTAGLAQTPVTVNISGCPNSCAQQQLADIGLSGMTRRAGGTQAPGYRILLGGGTDTTGAYLGHYVARTLARQVPQTVVAIVRRYTDDRTDGETFRAWVHRVGTDTLAAELTAVDPGTSPGTIATELLTDWDSADPYRIALGRSECGG
jgi:sulfite reductase beta subunit-like hemoprotein